MTIEEKTEQMNTYALPITRLAVEKYHWWNEALHGVKSPNATSFPQARLYFIAIILVGLI